MPKKKQIADSKCPFSKRHLILLFFFIYIILSLLLFDPKLFTGGDNAVYIILANSIVDGKGFKNIHMPGEPPHTQYPFGFPLFLTLFILIFGNNVIILKSILLLTGLGSLYFMYKISKNLFKERTYFVVPFYISVPLFIIYNHWILSEMPFLFFSLGSLYYFNKAQINKNFYYVSFLFTTYAFFIRTAGIALILGMLLFLMFKKEYIYFGILLLIFLVFFIPWQIRNASIPREGGYIAQLLAKDPYQIELGQASFIELIKRAWDNFVLYTFMILPTTLLSLIKSAGLKAIMGFVLLTLTVTGFIKRIKHTTIIELYFIFAILVLLGWPRVWSSDRFLLPILPIFIIYIFFGVFWLAEKIGSKYCVPIATGILILLNIIEMIPLARESIINNRAYLQGDNYAGYSPDWRRYFELIAWVKKNIPEDMIIMARKPEFVYLLSNHKSILYPFSADQNIVRDAIERSDYIILDNFYWTGTTRRYLLPVLQKEPQNYEITHRTGRPEFYLLKIKKIGRP